MDKADTLSAFPSRLIILLIQCYRFFLSPWLGNNCRFYPSCSHYAEEAIRKHGLARGAMLSVKRLACCHPWHTGGHDPVPECTATAGAATDDR